MTAHTARVAFAKVVLNEARLTWRAPRGLIFGVGLPAFLVVLFGELPKDQVHNSSLGGLTRPSSCRSCSSRACGCPARK